MRISDLPALIPSTAGKLEFETFEDGEDAQVLDKLVRQACAAVFRRHFTIQEWAPLIQRFDRGAYTVEVGERTPTPAYADLARELPGIDTALQKLDEPRTPGTEAAVLEFVLEGLHLAKRLNKTAVDGVAIYGA